MTQKPTEGTSPAQTGRALEWAAAAIPVLASVVFLALWWRSYLGVTNDGWHFFGAWRILNGEVPYRDYYLFIPPFHQLKIAAIISVFGKTLIAPQVVGFLERIALSAALYFWLRRAYGRASSALASAFALTMYYYASSETLSSMIHEAAVWAVFAGACAAAALDSKDKRLSWWFGAGVFAGVAFITKQTSGAGIAIAVFSFAGVRAILPGAGAKERKDLLSASAGWLAPVALVGLWLWTNGALATFVDQVFLRGPASKGTPAEIALRPLSMLVNDPWQLRYTVMSIVIAAALLWATRLRSDRSGAAANDATRLAALGVASAIGLGAALGLAGGVPIHPFLEPLPVAVTLRCTLLFAIAMSLVAGVRWIRESPASSLHAQVFLLAWVSLWISIFSSLSWALMMIMAIPGIAFMTAAALDASPRRWVSVKAWRGLVAASALGAMVFLVQAKLVRPFGWSGWVEPPVTQATETSELPLLAGLRLSPATNDFVNKVTEAVRAGSGPEDEVFVYPHMPLFYLLAERRPATFAPVHFFDVCPDALAREDAERILADPPQSIVFFHHTEAEIAGAEQMFRGGRRSGQRDLMDAIDRLTSAGYELTEDLRTPLTDHTVQVWTRRAP